MSPPTRTFLRASPPPPTTASPHAPPSPCPTCSCAAVGCPTASSTPSPTPFIGAHPVWLHGGPTQRRSTSVQESPPGYCRSTPGPPSGTANSIPREGPDSGACRRQLDDHAEPGTAVLVEAVLEDESPPGLTQQIGDDSQTP